MNLAKFREKIYRVIYPIEKLNNFSEVCGPTIYFKRDDLLGLTAGGNKTRKLEFLVADAQAKGAYVNYSWWYSVKSLPPNTCSAVKKMKCILVLEEGLEPEPTLMEISYIIY